MIKKNLSEAKGNPSKNFNSSAIAKVTEFIRVRNFGSTQSMKKQGQKKN